MKMFAAACTQACGGNNWMQKKTTKKQKIMGIPLGKLSWHNESNLETICVGKFSNWMSLTVGSTGVLSWNQSVRLPVHSLYIHCIVCQGAVRVSPIKVWVLALWTRPTKLKGNKLTVCHCVQCIYLGYSVSWLRYGSSCDELMVLLVYLCST